MKEGIQGQAPDQSKMKQMMEAAQSAEKSKGIEQPSKPKGESGLINNLEQATTEVAKKLGEGLMKLINPMIWLAAAVNITRPFLAQADDYIESGYSKAPKLFS
jgi:hypothetical protein